ncbi:hypothetical protein [Providencia sp. PROV037]|uniref:hypothetical protein n=1 Tax=Providencia sp. PROV037 TaxID=2949768 RepID=UPI00234B084E
MAGVSPGSRHRGIPGQEEGAGGNRSAHRKQAVRQRGRPTARGGRGTGRQGRVVDRLDSVSVALITPSPH